MDSFKILSLLLLLPFLSISSAFVQPDCGSCNPKKPTPPVTDPKLPLPLPPVPKLPLPLPPVPKLPVPIPKLPLPPVPKLPLPPVPKLPVPPVPKLPLPPVPKLPVPPVPKLPLPPVPKLPVPPVAVPKLPLPPVAVPKLPLPLPPVAVPKLPLPPVPKLPIPPVTEPPAGGKGGCPPPKPQGGESCPIDTLKLGACVDLLGGLVHVVVGDPAVNECCPIIAGLVEAEAAVCLCTTLKLKALNLKIFVPIALELLVTCGKSPPPGFTCSL